MVKSVDTRDLKSLGETHAGSIPAERTKCRVCRLERLANGHDPCIPNLPGVKYACCGHGGLGYIYFTNGVVIRFPSLYEVSHRIDDDFYKKVTLFLDRSQPIVDLSVENGPNWPDET